MGISFVGTGTLVNNNGQANLTVPLPAGGQADDIIIVVCGHSGQSGGMTPAIADYNVKFRKMSGNGGCALFWKRHTGSEANPVITGYGYYTSQNAAAILIRGVTTDADPWDGFVEAPALLGPGTYTIPAYSTSVPGCFVVSAHGGNGWRDWNAWGYGALSNTGCWHVSNGFSYDSGAQCQYGIKETAGSCGTMTTARTSSYQWVGIGALKPAGGDMFADGMWG